MNKNPANLKETLQMIKNHQLSPGEGLRLIKEWRQKLNKVKKTGTGAAERIEKMYYRGEWEEAALAASNKSKPSGHILIFDTVEELYHAVREKLKREGENGSQVILVKPGEEGYRDFGDHLYEINPAEQSDYRKLIEDLKRQDLLPGQIIHAWTREGLAGNIEFLKAELNKGVYSLLFLSQELMKCKPREKIRLLYIYPVAQGREQPQNAAISAFNKTLRQENPSFIYKTIEMRALSGTPPVKPSSTVDLIWSELQTEADHEAEIRYENGRRYVKRLKEVERQKETPQMPPLKERGVYLITGGAGGLGLLFAEYLAKKVKAKLILTGRSELAFAKEKKLQELESCGAEVIYVKADVSNRTDLTELIQKVKSRHPKINGVIHSAGIIRDSFILQKTKEEMDSVLAAKIYGTIYLEETFKKENLDFLVLFSSATAAIGNVGQSDYAYGNSFMDHFALMHAQEGRPDKIFSINWPLWKEGGMKVKEETETWLKKTLGMVPLSTANGFETFEDALRFSIPQLMVAEGEGDKIREALSDRDPGREKSNVSIELGDREKVELRERTENYLKNILSKAIRLPASRIDAREPFDKYGIDSIMVMNMMRELEHHFGELSKTLFFEYQNIFELGKYFMENHREKVIEKIGGITKPRTVKAALGKVEERELTSFSRKRFIGETSRYREEKIEEIAIIGLSGRYPGAENIAEFWENLKKSRDCITEIPGDRWDYREYYDPDQERPGKSYSKWGGFISDVDKFDPLFFNISPREAELMDPQERLFLETVWHTLEDAGYTREQLGKIKTGVFVGVMYGQYQLFGAEESQQGNVIGLSSSYASIANRVSYHGNFHGPSIALDTMCSSSLTAIHLACDSIRKGESEVAIAGGVNVSIHPNKYILLSQSRFVSSDGRCRSFGTGGDGYVPGEGVGAVLLKPLARAVADGDRIYAVIKGSSLNHGGKTNGYTVPNPNAQADLISEAFKEARIDPRTISYLEAHGTGTPLGDPIEITGLMKAFGEFTQEKQYCAIGSVKSNIGHLESAAGIAGVTKVLLQMKHQQLVPSLHSERLNPNINFIDSPFYVQRELTDWEQPVIMGKRYPRRTGISSFGAGGSNAHLILEEFEAPAPAGIETQEPQLFVLSARNEERLSVYAKEMVKFLEQEIGSQRVEPAALCYTLQIGREAMEERLAVIVSDLKELKKKLSEYCQGKIDPENLYRGNIKKDKDKAGLVAGGRAGEEFVRAVINDRDLNKLAGLWVAGVEIDWQIFHSANRANRIALPVYPFAKERYWFPQAGRIKKQAAKLHPLVDQNLSSLKDWEFVTELAGNEFYLTDQVVRRRKILSGTTCLEMMRSAGEIAGGNKVCKIKEVIWAGPVVLNESLREMRIKLYPGADGVGCELSAAGEDRQEIVHVQGELIYYNAADQPEFVTIDLESIKARCSAQVSGAECYQLFQTNGLQYGPGFQVLQKFLGNQIEALSYLKLPEKLTEDFTKFGLHPALLDGVFQTALKLTNMIENSNIPRLLWKLDEVEIIRPLQTAVYGYVRLTTEVASSPVKRFEIQLTHEAGQLLVQMKNVVLAVVDLRDRLSEKTVPYLLEKCWRESTEVIPKLQNDSGLMVVLVNEETGKVAAKLFQDHNLRKTIRIIVQNGVKFERHSAYEYVADLTRADHGARLAQELLAQKDRFTGCIDLSDFRSKPVGKSAGSMGRIVFLQELIKNVNPDDSLRILHFTKELQTFQAKQPTLAGADFAGLIKMLSAEYRKVRSRTIDVDLSLEDVAHFREIIFQELNAADFETEICYRNGQRYIPFLKELESQADQPGPVIDPDKVIVITGGTRGIGAELARHLAGQGARKLVLMGIQALPPREQWEGMLHDRQVERGIVDKLKLITDLEQQGVRVELYTGSLTQKSKLNQFFKEIRQRLGTIGGVMHCAGLAINENPAFINKQVTDMERVFEPKIAGLETLQEILAGDQLDFFILFSSVSGVIPLLAAGMSDYAAANAFMDYFAAYQHSKGKRYFRSINWTSWKEAGMGEVVSPIYRQLGLVSHSTREGMAFFDNIFKFGATVGVIPCLAGEPFRTEGLLQVKPELNQEWKAVTGKNRVALLKTAEAPTGTQSKLRELFSQELKIPETKLDAQTPFGDFGVDSILLAELVKKIEVWLGRKLDPSILLEYPTLKLLSHYLEQNHPAGTTNEMAPTAEVESVESLEEKDCLDFIIDSRPPLTSFAAYRPEPAGSGWGSRETGLRKIAVIGMACHFPGAGDKDRFWENLAAGKSSIVEVPQSRWDVNRFYASQYQKGKSISRWGGFIEAIEYFDPGYFNIKEEDAPHMDPLIRQFLEVSVATLRDAGYEKEELWNKKVGVFVGSRVGNYATKIRQSQKNSITGVGQNFIAAHVSHFFNFKGPNMVVDTACSSSLVSIHLACQSLLLKESDVALAGGVDILLDEEPYLVLSEGRALSPDGKCHTFDENANGFVPGEGCGAVLLKPLAKAITDGDRIYAVIDGSAVNNDGHTMGITTPNPEAQTEVIQEALQKGGIDPGSISYIETHGTGTMIGDPIELKALTKIFQQSTSEKEFCGVGSVKTNLGHLLSAAGIASFIKVVLSICHQQLPPSLNCETPNPRFEFRSSPFYPNTVLKEWEPRSGLRRAGISSFGFGGTNAHMIVSECESGLLKQYQKRRSPLPPIHFNRKKYWIAKTNPIEEPSENLKMTLNMVSPRDEEQEIIFPTQDYLDNLPSLLEFVEETLESQ